MTASLGFQLNAVRCDEDISVDGLLAGRGDMTHGRVLAST